MPLKRIDVAAIQAQNLCWSDQRIDDIQYADVTDPPADYSLVEFLDLPQLSDEEKLWVILDEKYMTPAQLCEFAAAAAEHVYPVASHFDGAGVFSEAIEAARSGDLDRIAEARRTSHRLLRRTARSDPKKTILRALQAARGCTKEDPRDAATTAAWRAFEAVADPATESAWQIAYLRGVLA